MSGSIPERYWYQKTALSCLWVLLLFPVTCLYAVISGLRVLAYRTGMATQQRFSVPLIVVGNISVGGTGKTPVVIALVELLRAKGWKPGVVSRGYGGDAPAYPLEVKADTPIQLSGDEPGLIARQTGCPVVVDPDRSRAVNHLIGCNTVDVVVSDDGLQHYAMGRDAEIAVVDAQRRLGNGFLLPSGPLRELSTRLKSVDMVMVNGGDDNESAMQLEQGDAVNLVSREKLSVSCFVSSPVHAVAGIGNPERFFSQLQSRGLTVKKHAFPDHHHFQKDDLDFGDDLPILMTAKDAVKCQTFASANCWEVPVDAVFNSHAQDDLEKLLSRLETLRKTDG